MRYDLFDFEKFGRNGAKDIEYYQAVTKVIERRKGGQTYAF